MENLTEISNNKSELNGKNIHSTQPESDLSSKLFTLEKKGFALNKFMHKSCR